MADQRSTSTKRNATTRATTPDQNEHTLPTPATSGREGSGRRKQLPTVTPRRFRKFFTPRSSLRGNIKVTTSRQVLRDITDGDSNCRSLGRRRSSRVDEIQILEDENEEALDTSWKRKRRLPQTPEPTPELSSPLKRCRRLSVEDSDTASDTEQGLSSSDLSRYKSLQTNSLANTRPIGRWRQHGLSGQRLQQELGGLSRTRGRVQLDYGSGKPKNLDGLVK